VQLNCIMTAFVRPVTLLTGFLGSGKTTFLNQWIKAKRPLRIAIIENELGKESPDGMLIEATYDDILEINSGCFCCSGQRRLMDLLEHLADRHLEFDEIVIELTGIANPLSLKEQLTKHPLLRAHFPLKQIICLIDTETITERSKSNEEVVAQLVASDIWVWNHCESVSYDELQNLQAEFSELNPFALHYRNSGKTFPVEEVFNSQNCEPGIAELKKRDTITNTHEIHALSFSFPGHFRIDMLYYRLFQLMHIQNGDLMRIKAVLYKPDEAHKIILQGAGRHVYMDPGPIWEESEQKTNTILLIGKSLVEENYRKLFSRYLV
jgi:G3E family GTPase